MLHVCSCPKVFGYSRCVYFVLVLFAFQFWRFYCYINGALHAGIGMMKDRKSKHLTEAKDIKKRWQEYTEELYKKGLNDLDNLDDVVTHLEPDILECEVKWALGSITMNKASGGDGFPVELFQILKDDAVLKCCTPQYASKFGKLRSGKAQFSFQSQRRAMPKNVQTTVQLCLFDMLAR